MFDFHNKRHTVFWNFELPHVYNTLIKRLHFSSSKRAENAVLRDYIVSDIYTTHKKYEIHLKALSQ